MTHAERMAYQRKRRKANGNSYTRKYEKTPSGFLMRAYRNMQSRVTGVQKKKAHLYLGLELLPREDFYRWSRDHPDFWRLYRQWTATAYDRRLCPTVNRINPRRGYSIDNMEWVTHSVNSALSARKVRLALEALYATVA